MAEKQNTPEIRFKGFTDPWEQRKLGDVATIVGGGTPSTNNDAYWDGEIDWYSPAELGERVYADRSVRRITQAGYDSCSATLLPAGKTILFTSRAGIGNTAILRRSACTNQGFQSLVVNDDIDVYFVYSMTDRIKKFAEQKASGSTFLEISGKGLAAGEFAFPSKDEQTAIGSMFKQLDNLITLHQRKHDKLCTVKRSMLDKMFPKPGETEPEIRFKGFTDPWEQRKLGEVADRYDNLRIPITASERVPGSTPYYGANGIQDYVEGFTHQGEFVLIAEDGASDLDNYPTMCINGIIWVNNHAHVIQGRKDITDNHFIAWSIKRCDIKPMLTGGTRAKLNAEVLMGMRISTPNHAEQISIGSFFEHLDSLITLHQRKLDLLKNTKKSLLDKMFV